MMEMEIYALYLDQNVILKQNQKQYHPLILCFMPQYPIKKYYLHEHPSKGYKIKEKYQFPSPSQSFQNIIQQINQAYHICSIKQQQALTNLPQNYSLFIEISCLAVLPLLKAVLLTNFCTLFEEYLCLFVYLFWKIFQVMKDSDGSRHRFEDARVELMEKLEEIEGNFNQSSEEYMVRFSSEGEQDKIRRYIEFYRKKDQNYRSGGESLIEYKKSK